MDTKSHAAVAQALASKYQVPAATVEHLFQSESATLGAQARVTAFLPIIVARRVEEQLRATSAKAHSELQHAA